MTTITSLELCTVPLTEEGVERYKISDPIDNHLTTILLFPDDLNCSVGRIFNKVKVPVSWITVNSANYIKATMEFNNPSGSSLEIRGWIDSIDPLSDTENYAQVEVKWHFDYWEMYKSLVTFGYGHIKRRPFNVIADTPVQNYQKRYEKLGSYSLSVIDMMVKRDMLVWWVIVSANVTSGAITWTRIYTYPVMVDAAGTIVQAYFQVRDPDDGYNTKSVTGCSVRHIYAGDIDEFIGNVLGTAPDAVNGIWISPFCPYITETNITGTGTSADPFILGSLSPVAKVSGSNGSLIEIPWTTRPLDIYREKTFTKIMSTEESRYILASMDGVKILELPYGFEVDKVRTTLILEPDGPYFEFSFKDLSYGNLEGLVVNVPLLSFPMNSNSYASYVYSGRQEYDRNMRTVRSNSDAWKNSASGGSTGALFGAVGPIGGLLGTVAGAAPGLISYGVEMGYQNDQEQELENRLQANQPSTMILSSNALLSYIRGYGFVIKNIVPDDYSAARIVDTRSNQGVSVDEILSSCDTQVRTTAPTGYYNIQNLIITGSVPKEAKDYIKKKFASGVKLL